MEQKRVHEILEPARPGDFESKIFDVILVALIIFGSFVAIFATMEDITARYGNLIWGLEVLLVLIFTQEYALRIWSCTAEQRYEHPFWGRIRWATSPMGLVDLIAFLPWYVFLLFPSTGLAQLIFLFRLLRLFKLFRYSESLQTLAIVIKRKRDELTTVLIAVLVLIVLMSSLMYMIERRAQPEVFSSVPAALWWGVVTLTTVGYGDMYPVTVVGRLLAGVMALLGIGFIALPAGILASGFAEEIRKRRGNTQVCPHCGKDINKQPEEIISGDVHRARRKGY